MLVFNGSGSFAFASVGSGSFLNYATEAPPPVGFTGSLGNVKHIAYGDHTHEGVHSISGSGGITIIHLGAGDYVISGSGGGGGSANITGSSIVTVYLSGGFSVVDLTGSGVSGSVARDRGDGVIQMQRLTLDDIDPAFAINSFNVGSSVFEIGQTYTDPTFTATYNALLTPPATLNDGTNTDPITFPATASFGYNNFNASGLPSRSYSKSVVGQSVTWTLTVNKLAGPQKQRTTSATWYAKVYYGIVTLPGSYDETFIEGLGSSTLKTSRQGSYVFGAGAVNKKIHIAWPASFGGSATNFTAAGFTFPMSKIAANVAVTSSFGAAALYDVWQSDNFIVPAFTVDVS